MPKIFADSGMHNLVLNILHRLVFRLFFDRLSYLEAISLFQIKMRVLFQMFFLKILIRLKSEN